MDIKIINNNFQCSGQYNESVALLKDYISVMGLTTRQVKYVFTHKYFIR